MAQKGESFVLCEKWASTIDSPVFRPTDTTGASSFQWRWKELETRVGKL